MLVQEYMIRPYANNVSWVLLDLVNRAFVGEYHMANVTRQRLAQLQTDGVANLPAIRMGLPSEANAAVRGGSVPRGCLLPSVHCVPPQPGACAPRILAVLVPCVLACVLACMLTCI